MRAASRGVSPRWSGSLFKGIEDESVVSRPGMQHARQGNQVSPLTARRPPRGAGGAGSPPPPSGRPTTRRCASSLFVCLFVWNGDCLSEARESLIDQLEFVWNGDCLSEAESSV